MEKKIETFSSGLRIKDLISIGPKGSYTNSLEKSSSKQDFKFTVDKQSPKKRTDDFILEEDDEDEVDEDSPESDSSKK